MTMMIMMMGEGGANSKIYLIETGKFGKFAVQVSGNLALFPLLKYTRGRSHCGRGHIAKHILPTSRYEVTQVKTDSEMAMQRFVWMNTL